MEIFLDAAAHMPMNSRALKAFCDFNEKLAATGHPLAPSKAGREAANAIEYARDKIAQLIGAKSSNQIVFTSTCTEACSWALEMFKNIGLDRVYSSPIEHPAIKHRYRELFEPHYLPVSDSGCVSNLFEFPENTGVVCLHVQPEIGTIQPITELKTKYLLSDMSQSLGKLNINVSSMPNLYFACFGMHKIGGSAGVGFIYLSDSNLYKERVGDSGSKYWLDRPGSSDSAGIVASAVALEDAMQTLPRRYENMINFRSVLESGFEQMGWKVIGKGTERLPNITFVHVPKSSSIFLMTQLETVGIHIGLGSSCNFLGRPTALMTELSLPGSTNDYIRISQWGDYTAKDAKYVLEMCNKFLPKH